MFAFPWGLFAVLVGTLLPFSVLVRSSAQIVHDRHLGVKHPVNVYRAIKGVLVIPLIALIGPAGFYLLFDYGDIDLAARVVKFLGTPRGIVVTLSMLAGILMIDIFRPRLVQQLTQPPISELRRTPLEFRNDTVLLGGIVGLALAAAVLA